MKKSPIALRSERGRLPKNTPHLMVDLLEIEAFFYKRAPLSKSDIEGIVYQLDEANDNQEDDGMPADELSDNPTLSSAEINDGRIAKVDDWLEYLKFREKSYGKFYPFYVSKGILHVRESLTKKQELYLTLLICSRLVCIDQSTGQRQRLARLFEEISHAALKEMLPSFNVEMFAAGSDDRNKFGGSTKDAFKYLASIFREELHKDALDELPKGTGDKGIDILAYYPWTDNVNSITSVWAQCASKTEDWLDKALEAHPINLSGYMNCRHSPANFLFIPVCYRKSDGNWVEKLQPWATVLVDRSRIISLLNHTMLNRLLKMHDVKKSKIVPSKGKKQKGKKKKNAKKKSAGKNVLKKKKKK